MNSHWPTSVTANQQPTALRNTTSARYCFRSRIRVGYHGAGPAAGPMQRAAGWLQRVARDAAPRWLYSLGAPSPRVLRKRPRVTAPRARLRVLVADDEAPARRVLVRLLEAHHDIHVVAECADGANAALRIREVRPELIFLDVKMPELDGFEVIERVGVDAM